jgi:hypothetical protein
VYWKLVVSTIPLDCGEKLEDVWIASPVGNNALWFLRIEEYVVEFQLIPTVLSGLTVKKRAFCCTDAVGKVAACPAGLRVETRVTSRRAVATYRALTRANDND